LYYPRTDAQRFWQLDSKRQHDYLARFRAIGAKAVIAYELTAPPSAEWRRMGTTNAYVQFLQ
ncbi:MAG: hypothetical protein ABSD20_11360, partial [Terriglobales bacterium]